ncbi:hypothetical protein ILUMI_24547 [Ignelater luminosus]|uniref:asparaginase n=1 Tax=Ignelater luminosus TaxID=2038154 RepID=A0A8K0C6W1_IGNLU|nr:hypothetical protein ILUMI_24547 [Ignelater luminosus]
MPSECNDIIRKVLVLYTGGTIGMRKNEKGAYEPSPNAFIRKIRSIPQMHDEEFAKSYFGEENSDELIIPHVHNDHIVVYLIKEYDPLYDSSNMSTKDWIRIAKDVEENYCKYDGFVILHGTDTLAYTASALSFMLDGLQKPVIVTGAQIPIFENRSDAKGNFLSSLIIAGCFDIPEVCIFFANKLMRGNRTAKISSNLLDAFNSPNFHVLANVGIHINVFQHYLFKSNSKPTLRVHTNLNSNIVLLPLFPTITSDMVQAFIHPSVEGVVLQSYGVGNVPSDRKDLLDVLKRAIERGVIIINITQCAQGAVSPSYETGRTLKEIGLLPGYDMTAEAALSKLSFVLGQGHLLLDEKKQLMLSNLRGELTVTD